jgi:hypothetical protein
MLTDRDAEVRAFARTPPVNLPDGAAFVAGDLAEPSSLAPALEGVDAAFLLWPQATAVGHAPTVELLASRVPRIVYLSSLTVRDADDALAHPMSASTRSCGPGGSTRTRASGRRRSASTAASGFRTRTPAVRRSTSAISRRSPRRRCWNRRASPIASS